jgi:hypothetical protein
MGLKAHAFTVLSTCGVFIRRCEGWGTRPSISALSSDLGLGLKSMLERMSRRDAGATVEGNFKNWPIGRLAVPGASISIFGPTK